jgi:hypothetical protein
MAGTGKKPKRQKRPRQGSKKREPVGKPGAQVHNMPRGTWKKVCGEVTRMGGQLVEIPAAK